ncbi:ScbR family autoregulator-binding transcription factor [Streptomyces sp. NPDC060194]|uniref:ScbR family autoregulator-binding transcription factor n=1 Tax=Streptomyces sp. NPDC060194 TaxID=3347069 RepID=UPI003664DCFE
MARQERAVRTRQKIIVAAAGVFDEVGYEAATISQILKASGVTKGALYFHFTSKEELAQAVLAGQVAALPSVPERKVVLQRLIDEALVLAHLLALGDPMVRGGVRLTVEQGAPLDGLDRQEPMRGWIEHCTELLREAEARGETLPDVDIDAAARIFVGGFTGVHVLSKIMTGHVGLVDWEMDLMRSLVAGVAVPAVFERLDFSSARASGVYREAVEEADAGR